MSATKQEAQAEAKRGHTPTLHYRGRRDGLHVVETMETLPFCTAYSETDAKAIVTACNAYASNQKTIQELKATIKYTLEAIRPRSGTINSYDVLAGDAVLHRLNAALAKLASVEGKGEL